MKLYTTSAEFTLKAEDIDHVSETITGFLKNCGQEKSNILKIRLAMEDVLLNWRTFFGEETPIRLSTGKRLGRPFIHFELDGEQNDPLSHNETDFGEYSSQMMATMGLCPTYSYHKGTNEVSLRLRKKRINPLLGLIIAVFAAFLVAVLGYFLPASARDVVSSDYLTPLYETFFGILSTIAGPMIFLSVAWGIYGIGDAAILGRIGKKMLLRYFGITALFTAATFLMIFPFMHLSYANTALNSSAVSGIFKLLLGIFPKDVFSPFLEGNTMQIILIATVVGCIMLILGNQTKLMATLIEQINSVIHYLMELIGSMVTAFIFVILLRLLWSDSVTSMWTAWKPLVIFVALAFVFLVLVTAYVSFTKKVNPILFVKKTFPTFLIALTTASSSAAFGANVSCCEHSLGIDSKMTNFGTPLGIVLFKPATSVSFAISTLYFSQIYHIEISLVWLLTAILVITIVSIALPPVPGGALACYTIVFTQLGIPQEALAVTMLLDVFFDFISTGCDTFFRQCELLLQADRIGMLDKSILRKK